MRRLLTALVPVCLLVAAGCAGDDGAAGEGTPTTRESAPAAAEAFAVGRRSIELVDTSRTTSADPSRDREELPERTLPVLLLYPAEGEPTSPTEIADDAPVAEGTFPLVIFSHGVGASGPIYENRIKEWARAGYVVAAPTFPLSSGRGGKLSDYPNQPADVQFVLDEVLSLPDDDPLAPHIDPELSAAAGHSLGAITSLGVGLTSCCSDPRLDAVVELSGALVPFKGSGVDEPDRLPFLAVHGEQDTTLSISGSDRLFEEARGPAAYLRLTDQGHSDYLREDGPLVDATVIAFLDQYLRGEQGALDSIPALVEARGNATFEVKPGG